MTRVVNIHKEKCTVFIGRKKSGMHWGNPFSHLPISRAVVVVKDREESIRAFDQWYAGDAYQEIEPERRTWMRNNIHVLHGEVLGCFCDPLACHGHSLARHAKAEADRRSMEKEKK